EVVKLGQDLHAAQATVAVQLDGSLPKRAQVILIGRYIAWVKALQAEYPNAKFYSCYEAGPCGYWLHRELTALGVINVVTAPTNLSGRRKTDKRDARKLVEALDRYVSGNTDAFSVVTVPTPEQEQRRSLPRHRATLIKQRKRCIQQGGSLLLQHGLRLGGVWRTKREWVQLQASQPSWIIRRLADYKQAAELYDEQIADVDRQIEELGKELKISAPKGVGLLTCLILLLETINWSRFKNRRQVSSYTGLCPSEFTTGETRKQGSVDKHGNPRVRHALIEAVWRLLRYQPSYPPLRKLIEAQNPRARRKAAVAVARRLAVDLWRLATGQTTPEKLGLIMAN
ncbi:MAG: IS110 family transposase, partial [Opitutaceae bacterium]